MHTFVTAGADVQSHAIYRLEGRKKVQALSVVFKRVGGAGTADRAGCRSAHLVYELSNNGCLVEVETSWAGWMTVLRGAFAQDVHSTPDIATERGIDGWLISNVEVVKLVCYTQQPMATFLGNPTYYECASNCAAVLDATAKEVEALEAAAEVEWPAGAETLGVLEAASIVRDAYMEAAREGAGVKGLSKDEKTGTRYLPKGWCQMGQQSHTAIKLPHAIDRRGPYLHSHLYSHVDGKLHQVAQHSMRAEGVILGHAAAALRLTFPSTLVDAFEAIGGRRWNGRFTYPPVEFQAPSARLTSDHVSELRLPFRALHYAQVGIRLACGNPLDGHVPKTRKAMAAVADEKITIREGFMPTSRHVDSGDVVDCDSTIVYIAMNRHEPT
jgi:hypothetical protein